MDEEPWRLGRRPALDGIRAVAVITLLAHHARVVPAGYIGVDVFFVLSGFLITALLLEEQTRTGTVRIGAFWWRRARRLLPALALLVAVVGGLGALGAGSYWVTPEATLAALTFTMNWFLFSEPFTALAHTWSLAIEEQFYLTWPLLVLGVGFRWGQRRLLHVAVVLAVASTIWAVLLSGWATVEHRAFGFDARVSPILMGCCLALWMHIRPRPKAALWGAPLALILLALITAGIGPAGLTGVVTTGLIWTVASHPAVPFLEGAVLRWVGRRSYGIYLWHVPIVYVISSMFDVHPVVVFGLAAAASAAAAGASYAFVERPCLMGRSPAARSPANSNPNPSSFGNAGDIEHSQSHEPS